MMHKYLATRTRSKIFVVTFVSFLLICSVYDRLWGVTIKNVFFLFQGKETPKRQEKRSGSYRRRRCFSKANNGRSKMRLQKHWISLLETRKRFRIFFGMGRIKC